jgi:ABC-2 type transport system permease protein
LISSLRRSFVYIADVRVGLSLVITVGFLALCMAHISWFFKTGYRLRN